MNPRDSEFKKEEKLGSGSFGTVWRVHRRKDGARFAMKEIDLRKLGSKQVMKEVETMMKLPPHRNIVQLHEHWMSADGKDMWLLLEYCSQGTLSQFLLASSRLSDAALLDLSDQLLRALSILEKSRIIHNDIKPDNIFIMEGNVPKIGDLGMARFTAVGSVLTTMPGGTLVFSSPEALSRYTGTDGKPLFFPEYATRDISYQSDVYSLGVVMWCLIMRRVPDRPGCATLLSPALVANAKLRELLNKMLQPDPAMRPRASQLISDPVVPDPVPPSVPVPMPDVMSPLEFEAAVSDQAVARHAYLDDLKAALPVCDASYLRAGGASDYDEAALISSIKKGICAILAQIEKPKSKDDIRVSQVQMRAHWHRERTALESQIQAAKESANQKRDQLLMDEKAAFAAQDFARANQMKEAKDASIRDGQRVEQELQVQF